jgi:hypothetical protein
LLINMKYRVAIGNKNVPAPKKVKQMSAIQAGKARRPICILLEKSFVCCAHFGGRFCFD